MPPRLTPSPAKGSYNPPNDAATYRDLLFFEERLKTNAASLQRRKSLYQLFLAQLLIAIAFLLSEVLLQTSFLAITYKLVLQQVLPEIYSADTEVQFHPYFASGLLFVSVTTLVLFFASGMYSEKIAYANQYVPHANKALRSFNMYLNVRKPPLRSKLRFNPLSFFFRRPSELQPTPAPLPMRSTPRTPSTTIPQIPHSSNPRGELIFSSRVDRSFRESYERYRAAFERKRDEKQRLAAAATWWGWFMLKMPWSEKLPVPPSPNLVNTHTRTLSASKRGRGLASAGPTPNSSRRSSPVPMRGGSIRGSRDGTPPVRLTQDEMCTRSMDL